jgi:signal transduction histidine kinase
VTDPKKPAAAAEDVAELERAMRDFSEIGASLVESYEALTRRAERVEHELYLANQELEHKVDELDAVLRSLPTGVVVLDAEGRIAAINAAALSILGEEEAELVCRTPPAALCELAADGTERELHHADGTRLVVAGRRAEVCGASGKATGSVEILDDRTALVELRERVHQMDKMAALGTMAAGIAHEIRNPMSAVGGFAELLLAELEEDSKAHRWASLIVEGARETENIVRSMLTFARPDPLVVEPVEPRALLDDAVSAALGVEPPAGLAVAVRADETRFAGDRIKLRQAIRNLVANAAQVQPEDGAIDVDLRVRDGRVLVAVSDAGPGIPHETASRVLDPFYTTRAEGTGLGLALASTIARAHGGSIEVSPERAELGGARLVLNFPYRPAA